MIPDRLKAFILKLRPATDKGEISWSEGAPEAYFCSHKNATLHIAPYTNDDTGEAAYVFRIVANGKTTPFAVEQNDADYSFMRDLYSSICANANDVDEDLKDFFD